MPIAYVLGPGAAKNEKSIGEGYGSCQMPAFGQGKGPGFKVANGWQ